MTKISFDLDFSKDSETLLKEIQDQAKAEVEKREGKERAKAYLSGLHKTVNDKIDTSFNSVTELIRALAEHASPSMQERISGSTATAGVRRKTVSMSRELYEKIKESLAKSSPNKAKIARESNVSVVQVRKVAEGGYDEKFKGSSVGRVSSEPKLGKSPSIDIPTSEPEVLQVAPPPAEIPEPENDPVIDESPVIPIDAGEEDSEMSDTSSSTVPDLPPPPSFSDQDDGGTGIPEVKIDSAIPPLPSFVDEETEESSHSAESGFESEGEMTSDAPPTADESLKDDSPTTTTLSPSLPPSGDSFADEDQEGTDSLRPSVTPLLPPPFDSSATEEANADDEILSSPPSLPPVPEDIPNKPKPPAPPPSFGVELDSPPSSLPTPPSPPTPAMDAEENDATGNLAPSKNLGLKAGGGKKPSLKLAGKLGKKNKPTLSITRPPIPKSLPPTPDS
jgi:hypothetical protein